MEVSIGHFVFLTLGVLAGAGLAWYVLRNKLALAEASDRAAGDVERALLAEEVKASSHEATGLRARLAELELRATNLQTELDSTSREPSPTILGIGGFANVPMYPQEWYGHVVATWR